MEISTGGSVDVLSKNSLCGIRSRSAGGGVRGEHGGGGGGRGSGAASAAPAADLGRRKRGRGAGVVAEGQMGATGFQPVTWSCCRSGEGFQP